jgi:acetyltransferase-like isoleucine patch superfamily enzyme
VALGKFRHRLILLYSGVVRLFCAILLDEIPWCRRLRGFLYGLVMPRRGKNFQVCSGAVLWGLEHLYVGPNVYVGPGVVIICLDKVEIGDGVLLGPQVVISNGNHRFIDGAYRLENTSAPVSIGAGSWIGAHATIVAGAHIGKGVLVAANACVTKSVDDYDIVGGVPAKSLKRPQA